MSLAILFRGRFDRLIAFGLSLGVFALYVSTLAPTVLRSDSGEFHVMPWVLGIAHAPGYPLLTLLGRLAMLLPFGDPAYRVNLLDAAASAAAVGLVYLAVLELTGRSDRSARAGALAAALSLGLGATYWQQSVVGGPRPLVFLFSALLIWLGLRAWRRPKPASLVWLALAAGLALTHHPNLLMLLPAAGLLVLGGKPSLLRRPALLGGMVLAFLLPLLMYLYLPLRSAMDPPLGATNLADPRELALYISAKHYQDTVLVNCGGSKLIQAQRYLVLLSLQYGPMLSLLALLGGLIVLVTAPIAGIALLYAFGLNAVFGICSALAMPDYVIPSYIVAAIWLGMLVSLQPRLLRGSPRLQLGLATLLIGLAVGLGGSRIVTGFAQQDMRGRLADADRGRLGIAQAPSGGIVLSDWESITPIWYAQHVEGVNRRIKTALVTAAPVSDVWLVETQKAIEDRPVSLTHWVPVMRDQYRPFPVNGLTEVNQRAVIDRTSGLGLRSPGRPIELLGYRLDRPSAHPGELVQLTLYQRLTRPQNVNYSPLLRLESNPPVELVLDASMRIPSSRWQDDEVVGESYLFSVPPWAQPGLLGMQLAYMASGQSELVQMLGGPWVRFGRLWIEPLDSATIARPADALASFGDQMVLRRFSVKGAMAGPPRLRGGGILEVEVAWSGLRWMDESYTLFLHLLDNEGRLVAQRDGLPLGGIYHTYKWVPGQTIVDWYQLELPSALPAGEYRLSIGAYHAMTTRRLPLLDASGGFSASSYHWGPLVVE